MLARFEDEVILDEDGLFKTPKLIEESRARILAEYDGADAETGLNFIDIEFEKLNLNLPIGEFTTPLIFSDPRTYIYVTGGKGFLKVLDITQVIIKSGIQKVAPFINTVVNFFPNRMEERNVSKFANSFLEVALKRPLPAMSLCGSNGMLVREVYAHTETITKVVVTEDAALYTCCAKTCEVRIWDPATLDLYGILN